MEEEDFQFKKYTNVFNFFISNKQLFVELCVVFIFVGMTLWGSYLLHTPRNFPTKRIIHIEQGSSLTEISRALEKESVITSPFVFKTIAHFLEKDTKAQAGDYFFDKPLSVFEITKRITHGNFNLVLVKITILEGSTVAEIATLFEAKFSEFNKTHFLEIAKGSEGYLFPDTYLFLPNITEKQVFEELRKNFDEKIITLQEEINVSEQTLENIVIMASLVEKEAWKEKDRKLISGVLWNRINIGMPLQVDASFLYINGKNTYTLTYDDLKIDSPYNTYKHKGLPVGPICNPSLSALKAAVLPSESDNLFYLADKSGNTYYALDFEGHKKNRRLYLD